MTNNPVKITGLKGYGLEITERIPIEIDSNPFNEKYLNTKVCKMGHVKQLDVHGTRKRRNSAITTPIIKLE